MRRFFLPDGLAEAHPGQRVTLGSPETHHLRNVLRLSSGAEVELFDGRGWSCRGTVESVARSESQIRLVTEPEAARPRTPAVWLACPAPKQERLRWLVEKTTELGVDRWIPLVTQRTVVEPGANKLQKLEDAVVQSCKQCGRNDLLVIEPPRTWADFIAGLSAEPSQLNPVLVADPSGDSIRDALATATASSAGTLAIVIGPEGGLTREELASAVAAGARLVRLADLVLRTETAAIAASAIVRAHLP